MRTFLASILLLIVSSPSFAAAPAAVEFFVAPNGSDASPGTREKPFATIAKARDAVRPLIAAGLKSPVNVYLREGTYRLNEPLAFGPAGLGDEKFAVTYAAQPGETVVISGGRPISGWKRGDGEVWTAPVPGVREGQWYFRHLFINGRRAVRARTPNEDAENPSWQLKGADLAADLSRYTLTLPPGLLGAWSNPSDIEIMVAGNWEINRLPVQSIDRQAGAVVLAPPHAQGHDAIRPGPGRWCHFESAPNCSINPANGTWIALPARSATGRCPVRTCSVPR